MLLSLVIPARDEEAGLARTVGELCAALEAARVPHEILVVNDHSRDATAAVADGLARRLPCVRRVDNPDAPGFGHAVRAGLDRFAGDAVGIVMADGSDAPEDVVAYHRLLEQGYACAFGSRFMPGSRVDGYPPLKLVLNRAANLFLRAAFRLPYNDVTNAFKAYRREVLAAVRPLSARHFELTVELPLKAIVRGFPYAVVPIRWRGRRTGASKLKIKEMGSRYFAAVLGVLRERRRARRRRGGRPI